MSGGPICRHAEGGELNKGVQPVGTAQGGKMRGADLHHTSPSGPSLHLALRIIVDRPLSVAASLIS